MALRTNITTIGQLNNIVRRPVITARIFKIWEALNPSNGSIYSIDFILVDQENNAIEGSIDIDHADEVRPKMIEGAIFEFSNFQVHHARASYRTVDHTYFLRFTLATTMTRKHESTDFPIVYFKFQNLESIGTTITTPNTIVDVIGKITLFKAVQTIQMVDRSVQLREIEIADECNNTAQITVWGNYTELLDEERIIEKSKTEPIVIAFSSLQLVKYNGFTLKSYSATRIYRDESIPQIAQLKQKFSPFALVVSPTREYKISIVNLHDLPTLTVKELLENVALADKPKEAKCTAKIVDVDESEGWYYKGCPTHLKKLKRTMNDYRCDTCKLKIENPKLCYRFFVVVSDDSQQEADFVFLGKHGDQVLGSSALEVSIENKMDNNNYPERIKALISHQFDFSVRYNPGSVNKGRPNFNVINATALIVIPGENTTASTPLAPPQKNDTPMTTIPKTPAKPTEDSKKPENSSSCGKSVTKDGPGSKKENLKSNAAKKRSYNET